MRFIKSVSIKHYQTEWFKDIALYSLMFLFLALAAYVIDLFLQSYIEQGTFIYNTLKFAKIGLLLLDVLGFLFMASLATLKLIYEASADFDFADFRRILVRIGRSKTNKAYQMLNIEFAAVVSIIDDYLGKFNPHTADKASIELLHWVPTFSLSRGLKRDCRLLAPLESSLYIKIKKHFENYGGRIICYDGLSMYSFLFVSKLLYDEPSNYVMYLREAYSMISNNKINVSFFNDKNFPYTLLILGSDCAVLDFTSNKDLIESEGFNQASHIETLLLITNDKDEIKRLRRNLFNPYFDACRIGVGNHERQKTLSFIECVANDIQASNKLETPEVYKAKYWDNFDAQKSQPMEG